MCVGVCVCLCLSVCHPCAGSSCQEAAAFGINAVGWKDTVNYYDVNVTRSKQAYADTMVKLAAYAHEGKTSELLHLIMASVNHNYGGQLRQALQTLKGADFIICDCEEEAAVCVCV